MLLNVAQQALLPRTRQKVCFSLSLSLSRTETPYHRRVFAAQSAFLQLEIQFREVDRSAVGLHQISGQISLRFDP